MIKILFKFIALSILIGSFATAWYWNEYQLFLKENIQLPDKQEKYILSISKGALLRDIAQDLQQQKIISNALFFRIYARVSNQAQKIKAGEYALNSDMTVVNVLTLLVSGKVTQYTQTIIEGLTVKESLKRIARDKYLIHSEDFSLPISRDDLISLKKKLGDQHKTLEGLLFPDTYNFPKGTTELQFIKRAYDRMQRILSQEWQAREKQTPLKSPYEALILASIVEKESGVSSERNKIAGVFIRRMNKGMRLQSDPTIIYGMGDTYKGNIRRRDINQKTAYNTYQIPRLPPTPIAIPGREAIHAVLHPDKGKSLYFVADGSGGHVFSNSLKEHNHAVRKYILKKK